MRIISLNTWGGHLWLQLAGFLSAEAPDILCLQEVIHSPVPAPDWLDYRDDGAQLPQRAHLFRDVAALLPDHVAHFAPAARGQLWDGATALPSLWGLATFVRADHPIIGQAQGFVHKDFSADGFGAHPRSRVAHVVRVHDPARGRAVTIGHMHGLRDPAAGKRDTPDRLRQAERFAGLIAGVAEPGAAPDEPLIVGGDFNVEPDSVTFAILADLGLADRTLAVAPEGTRTSYYDKPGRFADYVLTNPAAAAATVTVVRQPEVSDHCPLVVTL